LITTLPTGTAELESALSQVQRFDSQDYGQITAEDEFVDLHHLADLLVTTSSNLSVQQAAQAVLTATQRSQTGVLTTTVAYEAHTSGTHGGTWWDLEHANGIAIYYPPSNNVWDYSYYPSPVLRLSHDTRWDDLLVKHLGLVSTPEPIPMPAPPEPLEVQYLYLPMLLRRW
jgi:hypothetical protein